VGDVVDERTLGGELGLEPGQHPVDGVGQGVQLVTGTIRFDAPREVGGRDLSRGPGNGADRS
jgi:hypothetical protein